MAIEVIAKKWGNSIGIIIPSETINKLNIKPEEKIVIEIEKNENVLRELFGAVKFKRPVEDIIKETRKDLESKWMK